MAGTAQQHEQQAQVEEIEKVETSCTPTSGRATSSA
jgi:hypothetical protein